MFCSRRNRRRVASARIVCLAAESCQSLEQRRLLCGNPIAVTSPTENGVADSCAETGPQLPGAAEPVSSETVDQLFELAYDLPQEAAGENPAVAPASVELTPGPFDPGIISGLANAPVLKVPEGICPSPRFDHFSLFEDVTVPVDSGLIPAVDVELDAGGLNITEFDVQLETCLNELVGPEFFADVNQAVIRELNTLKTPDNQMPSAPVAPVLSPSQPGPAADPLSSSPWINRLFRNVGVQSPSEALKLMVTPRIIIQEEAEPK